MPPRRHNKGAPAPEPVAKPVSNAQSGPLKRTRSATASAASSRAGSVASEDGPPAGKNAKLVKRKQIVIEEESEEEEVASDEEDNEESSDASVKSEKIKAPARAKLSRKASEVTKKNEAVPSPVQEAPRNVFKTYLPGIGNERLNKRLNDIVAFDDPGSATFGPQQLPPYASFKWKKDTQIGWTAQDAQGRGIRVFLVGHVTSMQFTTMGGDPTDHVYTILKLVEDRDQAAMFNLLRTIDTNGRNFDTLRVGTWMNRDSNGKLVKATPFTKFFDGTTRVLGSERATRADDAAALDVSELELGDLVVVEALIGRYWTTKKGEPGSPSKDTSGGKNKFMSNANLILFGLHLLKKHEAYIEAPVTAKVSSSEGWGDL